MLLEVGNGIAKTRIPSMLGSDVLMKQTLRPECQCRTRIWVERRADGDVDHSSAEECANILKGGLHFRADSNNLWFSSHWDVDTSRHFLEMLITGNLLSGVSGGRKCRTLRWKLTRQLIYRPRAIRREHQWGQLQEGTYLEVVDGRQVGLTLWDP